MRMTLQPIDGPPTAEQLLQIIAQLDSDDFLMFSTDYPHWHFDSPEEAFPAKLPTSLARKILVRKCEGILSALGVYDSRNK